MVLAFIFYTIPLQFFTTKDTCIISIHVIMDIAQKEIVFYNYVDFLPEQKLNKNLFVYCMYILHLVRLVLLKKKLGKGKPKSKHLKSDKY